MKPRTGLTRTTDAKTSVQNSLMTNMRYTGDGAKCQMKGYNMAHLMPFTGDGTKQNGC